MSLTEERSNSLDRIGLAARAATTGGTLEKVNDFAHKRFCTPCRNRLHAPTYRVQSFNAVVLDLCEHRLRVEGSVKHCCISSPDLCLGYDESKAVAQGKDSQTYARSIAFRRALEDCGLENIGNDVRKGDTRQSLELFSVIKHLQALGRFNHTCRPEVPLVEHKNARSLNLPPLHHQSGSSRCASRPSCISCGKILTSSFSVSYDGKSFSSIE